MLLLFVLLQTIQTPTNKRGVAAAAAAASASEESSGEEYELLGEVRALRQPHGGYTSCVHIDDPSLHAVTTACSVCRV
jgi:hypothetical protein